jgi:deoxyuridine 5'-triphosphate nucleotidohydrolase
MSHYILELVVTEKGLPFYPSVGTVEKLTSENAGYDLKVVVDQPPTTMATLVPLGVRGRMYKTHPEGSRVVVDIDVHYTLEPRSSIYKSGFMMANSRGIIDRTYRGELMAPLISVGSSLKPLEAGTRLFQILAPDLGHIAEVHYVDSLPDTARGSGGFGSTGLK